MQYSSSNNSSNNNNNNNNNSSSTTVTVTPPSTSSSLSSSSTSSINNANVVTSNITSSSSINAPIGRKGYYLYFQPTSPSQSVSLQQQQPELGSSSSTPAQATTVNATTTTGASSSGLSSPNVSKSSQQQRFQRSSSHFNQSRLSRYEKERLKLGNKKIVAVGFIGMHEQSIDIVNDILQRKIFSEQHRCNIKKEFAENYHQTQASSPSSSLPSMVSGVTPPPLPSAFSSFPIDSYHDTESNTIYMYLDIFLDLNAVISFVKKQRALRKREEKSNMSFENELDYQLGEREYNVAKALLFMFHTCHITMFIHPDKRFDLKFLRLFRILQLAKQTINPAFLSHLGTSVFTHDLKFSSLYSPGRVLPVVAFVFYQRRAEWDKLKSRVGGTTEDEKVLDKMQQALELQVRAILKKGRFAGTDNTRTPLFMVDPTKCTFVVLEPESQFGNKKFMTDFTSMMFNLGSMDQGSQTNSSQRLFYARATCTPNKKPVYPQSVKPSLHNLEKIREFLDRQYEYFTKQMQSGKRYVLPSSFNWYHASFAFEEFMSMKSTNMTQQSKWRERDNTSEEKDSIGVLKIDVEMEKVKPLLNPDWQFSENRCVQAFNLVKQQFCTEEAMQRAKSAHELMELAMRTYDVYASGPYQERYKNDLLDELSAFFKSRQSELSEAPSEQESTKHRIMTYSFQFNEDYTTLSVATGPAQKSLKTLKQSATPTRVTKTVASPQNMSSYPSPVRAVQLVSLGTYDRYTPDKGLEIAGNRNSPVFLSSCEFSTPYHDIQFPTTSTRHVPLYGLMKSITAVKQLQKEQQAATNKSDLKSSSANKVSSSINGYDYTQRRRYRIYIGMEYEVRHDVSHGQTKSSFFTTPNILAAHLTKQHQSSKVHGHKQASTHKKNSPATFQQQYQHVLDDMSSLRNIPVRVPSHLADMDLNEHSANTHANKQQQQQNKSFAYLNRIILGIPDCNSCVSIAPKLIQETEQQQLSTSTDQRTGALSSTATITSSTVTFDFGNLQKIILPRGQFVALEFVYGDEIHTTTSSTDSQQQQQQQQANQGIDVMNSTKNMTITLGLNV